MAGLRKERDSKDRPGKLSWDDPISNPLGLTPRQLKFCAAYVAHPEHPPGRIYAKAGYRGTPGVAKVSARKLLKQGLILQEIARRRRMLGETTTDADGLIDTLRALVNADPADLFEPTPTRYRRLPKLRPWDEIDPLVRRGVKSMKVSPDGTIEIQMFDKISAIFLLGQHFGLFVEARAPAEPPPKASGVEEVAEAAPSTPEPEPPPRARPTIEQRLAERRNGGYSSNNGSSGGSFL